MFLFFFPMAITCTESGAIHGASQGHGRLGSGPIFFVHELGWPILNPQNGRSQDLKFNIAL